MNEASSKIEKLDPLFWDLVATKPKWQQTLARAAIYPIITAMKKLKRGKVFIENSVKYSFMNWQLKTVMSRYISINNEMEELKEKNDGLEQRVVKLKDLLARTYQANQKNMEDSNSIKKAQRETALELKALKQKDELHRLSYEEMLRMKEIETAFQYDMEAVISKAATNLLSQQESLLNNQSNTNKKIRELETDNESLKEMINILSTEISNNKTALLSYEEKCHMLSTQIHEKISEINHYKNKETQLLLLYEEEKQIKKDLEVELNILLSSRSTISTNLENLNTQRTNQEILQAQSEIHVLRTQLEFAEKKQRDTELAAERTFTELESLRNISKNLINSQTEVAQLTELVAELKRNAGGSIQLHHRANITTTTPTHPTTSTPQKSNHSLPITVTTLGAAVMSAPRPVKDTGMVTDIFGLLKETDIIKLKGGRQALDDIVATALSAASERLEMERERSEIELVQAKEIERLETITYMKQFQYLESWGDELLTIAARALVPFFDMTTTMTATSTSTAIITTTSSSTSSMFLSKEEVAHKGKLLSDKREALKLQISEYKQVCSQSVSMIWEAESVCVTAGKDLVLPVHIPSHEKLAFLEWQYAAYPSDFVHLKLVRPRTTTTTPSSHQHSTNAGEGLLLQSEVLSMAGGGKMMDAGTGASPPALLPVYSGAVALRGGGDQLLHICNGALWGSACVAYVIRLRFTNEESQLLKLQSMEKDLFILDQELLKLRMTVRFAKELAKQLSLLWSSWRLAKKGQLVLTAHFEKQERLQQQHQQHQQHPNRSLLLQQQQRLVKAKKQFEKIQILAKNALEENKEIPPLPSLQASEQSITLFQSTGNSMSPAPLLPDPAPMNITTTTSTTNTGNTITNDSVEGMRDKEEYDTNATTATNNSIVYCTESLNIRAASDLRIPILAKIAADDDFYATPRMYRIHWDWSVLQPKNTDLGFTIIEQQRNGVFTQIIPYKRAKWGGGPIGSTSNILNSVAVTRSLVEQHSNAIYVLLDNSYSWLTPKLIRYCITVELVTDDDDNNNNNNDSPNSSNDMNSDSHHIIQAASTDPETNNNNLVTEEEGRRSLEAFPTPNIETCNGTAIDNHNGSEVSKDIINIHSEVDVAIVSSHLSEVTFNINSNTTNNNNIPIESPMGSSITSNGNSTSVNIRTSNNNSCQYHDAELLSFDHEDEDEEEEEEVGNVEDDKGDLGAGEVHEVEEMQGGEAALSESDESKIPLSIVQLEALVPEIQRLYTSIQEYSMVYSTNILKDDFEDFSETKADSNNVGGEIL